MIAEVGVEAHPYFDCDGVNAAQLLYEMGCRPSILYAGPFAGARSLLLASVPPVQLEALSRIDPAGLAAFERTNRDFNNLIVVPGRNQHTENYYRGVVELATLARELDQALMARLEYVGELAVH